MILQILLFLQLIPVASYDLNWTNKQIKHFEVINNHEFLIYSTNSTEITKINVINNSRKSIFFKNRFSKEPFIVVVQDDKSFNVKFYDDHKISRYNEKLELIQDFEISSNSNYHLFLINKFNMIISINHFDYSAIIYDRFRGKVVRNIKKEEQSFFAIKSPTQMIKNQDNIILVDGYSLHYFDQQARFIRSETFSKDVLNILQVNQHNFILYSDGSLSLNGSILLNDVDNIRELNEKIYILLNNKILVYEL